MSVYNNNYTVTVMNSRGGGSLHTWLVFEPDSHFSLDSPSLQCAIECICTAIIETTDDTRRHDERKTFSISREQHDDQEIAIVGCNLCSDSVTQG